MTGQLTVRLPEDLDRSLQEAAERMQRKRSEVVRLALRRYLDRWRGPIVSTEAVLTEATHLLGRVHGGRRVCLDFFLRGAATLVPTSLKALARCRELVAKYADRPMATPRPPWSSSPRSSAPIRS